MCADFHVDRRDLDFNLYETLKVQDLCELPAFKEFSREVFDMIVDEAIRFGKEQLFPLNASSDEEGVHFEDGTVRMPKGFSDVYKAFCEGGWPGACMNPEFGGQGFPVTLGMAADESFFGACTAFNLTNLLTRGAGHLIEKFGTDELKKTYIEKLYSGEWSGTMCLTESNAGSDVGASKASAIEEGDHYLIRGTKVFITSGEHDLVDNIVHMVLARRAGAPGGTKGISLFVIPKFIPNADGGVGERNDVVCGGVEKKMGIHGSPTCTLNFGDNGKCHGWLLGEPEQGMRYMFKMMNDARLEVGQQGFAAAAAAYLMALKFSQERLQGQALKDMGKPDAGQTAIVHHPDVRRMLMFMRSSVEGMRALGLSTSLYIDLARHSADPGEREKYQFLIELLTPICKAYCSDLGFRVTETAMQVHGGYGYCREYMVEQYCRDVKIASIYEGTNGIQAADLLVRKVGGKGGARFMMYLNELNTVLEKAENHDSLGDLAKKLTEARDTLVNVTGHLGGYMPKGDAAYPLLQITPYLKLFGHVVMAHLLLGQALVAEEKRAAGNGDTSFYEEKVRVVRFFFAQTLPEIHALAESMRSGDRSALEVTFPDLSK